MTAPEREALVKALQEALEWAIPMAAIALENHRYDRIKNGHNGDITFVKENGERWVGLFQNEYDALLKARAALSLSLSPAVTVTEEMVERAAEVIAGDTAPVSFCRHTARIALERALKSTTPQTGSQE